MPPQHGWNCTSIEVVQWCTGGSLSHGRRVVYRVSHTVLLGIIPPVIFDVLTQWGGFAILIENDKTTIMTRGKVYNLE